MSYYLTYYSKVQSTLTGDVAKLKAQAYNRTVTKQFNRLDEMKLPTNMQAIRNECAQIIIDATFLKTAKPFHQRYTEFRIPKASGGYRTLHAPDDELKALQVRVKDFLQKTCKILCHNAVHSYVRNRNCKTAMETHKKRHARWFLKMDIQDFFDNCREDFLVNILKQVYPLCFLERRDIARLVAIGMIDQSIPQGAPTSPIFSNLYLIKFDLKMTEIKGICYTRYADDILISSSNTFDWLTTQNTVDRMLVDTYGLNLKRRKTRYGSCNGSNWNLGLMYNKDQDITVGHAKKHILKCMVHNYNRDKDTLSSEEQREQAYKLNGILGYYKFIEPEYFKDWELLPIPLA